MRKREFSIGSILFLAVLLAGLLPGSTARAGSSFWYGGDITEVFDLMPASFLFPNAADNLQTCLSDPTIGLPMGPVMSMMVGFDNLGGDERGFQMWEQGETWDGYTLLSILPGKPCTENPALAGQICSAVLIDMDGSLVHEWPGVTFPAKMLPNGDVMMGYDINRETENISELVQYDWCDEKVWSFNLAAESLGGGVLEDDLWQTDYGITNCGAPGPPIGTIPDGSAICTGGLFPGPPVTAIYLKNPGDDVPIGWHHDFQREGSATGYYSPGAGAMASGKSLILSMTYPDRAETPEIGGPFRLADDTIYEVDADGNLLFRWYARDHIEEFGFTEDDRETLRNNPWPAYSDMSTDYTHFNNVNKVGNNIRYDNGDIRFHPDNIIFDSRSLNIAGIIARHDFPSHGISEGDIVWKIGPYYKDGFPENKLGQIIGMHHLHMIQQGLPGAGNMLVFDNGGGAGVGPLIEGLPGTIFNTMRYYSRVIEFNPVTMEVVWEYTNKEAGDANGEDQRKFFSAFISSAQRLKNGNTLITEGAGGRVFEVTPDKRIVWEYYNEYNCLMAPGCPAEGTGLGFLGGWAVYRAYRIPYKWKPKKISCD